METNINKPQFAPDDAGPGLRLVDLPRRVHVYDRFPIQTGAEPVATINLPETTPAESIGFIVFGRDFEPSFYDGNIIIVNNTIPPKTGNEVICEVNGRMDLALLHGDLLVSPLRGRHFEIPLSQARHIYLVIANHINRGNANFLNVLD
jgi:hypothetical protein